MSKKPEEKRQPWMKFYPADWQADEGLGQCSLTARGLWIELIAIMHKAELFGHLLIAGCAPNDSQIALQVKSDAKTVRKAIEELEKWQVFSRSETGVIYSRRMIADAARARADRENGKVGGNPKLTKKTPGEDKGGVNPPDNQKDNGGDKAQKLEARSQRLEAADAATGTCPQGAPPGPVMPALNDLPGKWHHLTQSREVDKNGVTRAVAGGSYLDLAAEAVCRAAKIRSANWRGDWRPLIAWLQDGIDCDAVIVPAVDRVASRPNYQPPSSLQYFDRAIREAAANYSRGF